MMPAANRQFGARRATVGNLKLCALKSRPNGKPLDVSGKADSVVENLITDDMTEKENILLVTSTRIVETLKDFEFSLQSKGKSIAMYSADKDMKLEIIFQVNRHSQAQNLEIFPHIDISSKILKKWRAEQGVPNSTGIFFHTFLAYITPRKPRYEWTISGLSQENSVKGIAESIVDYAIPLFQILTETESAVDKLCEHIWEISKGIDSKFSHVLPLDYVLCFGSREKAEKLIETCIRKKVCTENFIHQRFEEFEKQGVKTVEEILKIPQKGFGQEWIGMAYLQKLKIK